MLAKVFTFGLLGIEAYPIEIEIDVSNGLPVVNLVGLPDSAIKESKERVKSAIKNSGFQWPADRITISLAPSDIKKEGSAFDLAISLGILAATGQINPEILKEFCLLGELSLDGSLRPVKGVLSVSMALVKHKIKKIIVPVANIKEAAIVAGISVWPIKTLNQAVEFLNNPDSYKPCRLELHELAQANACYSLDFAEVKGQKPARRALEVAVSGNHNILFIGPPGSGKTMLAKRIPTIMPDLNLEEALEVTKIHSAAGILPAHNGIIGMRPFRNPHHTASDIALTGGGSIPHPGEISLAHNGVLFLDELPEFHRNCLEILRQPLEDGHINICRSAKSFTFPASFMLVCAMNPCPCGYYTDFKKTCRCNPSKIQSYLNKISGPLLDRIDIHIELASMKYHDLIDAQESESSKEVRDRVEKARRVQKERFKSEGIYYNSQMNAKLIKKYCNLDSEAKALIKLAITELGFSARAYDKILKVARTISDLGSSEDILPEHIAEAVQYRSLDRHPNII